MRREVTDCQGPSVKKGYQFTLGVGEQECWVCEVTGKQGAEINKGNFINMKNIEKFKIFSTFTAIHTLAQNVHVYSLGYDPPGGYRPSLSTLIQKYSVLDCICKRDMLFIHFIFIFSSSKLQMISSYIYIYLWFVCVCYSVCFSIHVWVEHHLILHM